MKRIISVSGDGLPSLHHVLPALRAMAENWWGLEERLGPNRLRMEWYWLSVVRFEMGPAQKDSLWGTYQEPRGISIDAFWMDETEITNSKYKQFVFWVRDSIIRERLADPAYGGNEAFKIEEDREGNPVTPHLNWNKAIPWRNPTEDEARAIESVYRTNPITGKKNWMPRR